MVVPTVAAPVAPAVEITPTPAVAVPVVKKTPAPAPQPSATVSAPPVKTAPAQPDVAPAPPIAASKEQKLAWLLGLYKSNQLTPQQYHEQRAAILAEP